MDAKRLVRKMLEDGEDPKDFLARNDDIYPVSEKPTHEYRINLGEGSYRTGLMFTISATSRQEALHLANKFIQGLLHYAAGGFDIDVPHNLEGTGARASSVRAYIDDDCTVTDADIVDESPLGWTGIEPGGEQPPQ